MKLAQDAMLAETGEEDEFIKCFDDITGKEGASLAGCKGSARLWQSCGKVQRHASSRHKVGRH